MSDNILVTQGSGTTMATDDISSVHYPRVKLACGPDGTATDVPVGGGVEAAALRVTVASDSTGVLSVDDNGGSLTVDGTVAATQSGTWNIATVTTVSAVTAISNALPAGNNNIGDVDVASVVPGTGATNLGKAEDAAHSSGDVGVMSLAVRNDAGTALAADGDYVPLMTNSAGALYVTGGGGGTQYQEDSVAASGDTGTLALVVRRDTPSAGAADGDYCAASLDADGKLWVNAAVTSTVSTAVTNAGTFAVQATSVIPGVAATSLGKAEDAAHSSGDTGVATLAVRRDTAVAGAADGDYSTFNVDADGKLWVNAAVTSTVSTAVTNAGTFAVQATSVVPGVAATSLGKAEDAVHSSGDTGVMSLAVRSDAGAALAADGDYIPLMTNSVGSVYAAVTSQVPGTAATNLGKAVDAVGGATDTGVAALALRKDTLTTLTPADGDYTRLMTTSTGRLWSSATIDAALPAGTNAIGKLSANSGVDIGDVDVTSISAGANLIGDVGINGRATGSSTAITRFVSAATTNLNAVKASAGTLYGFSISNVKSSAVFVRFYNIASGSVTVGTSTVFAGPFIGPGATTGAGHTFSFPLGIPFSNAGWSVSITAGSLADNDTTATAASDCAITIMYV